MKFVHFPDGFVGVGSSTMMYDSSTKPTDASLTKAVHIVGSVGWESAAMPVVATAAPARSATVVFNMMFVDVGCGGGVDLVLILFDFMLYICEGRNPFNCILKSGIHALYFKTNSHVLSDDYISDPLQRFFIMLLCSAALHEMKSIDLSMDSLFPLYRHVVALY